MPRNGGLYYASLFPTNPAYNPSFRSLNQQFTWSPPAHQMVVTGEVVVHASWNLMYYGNRDLKGVIYERWLSQCSKLENVKLS